MSSRETTRLTTSHATTRGTTRGTTTRGTTTRGTTRGQSRAPEPDPDQDIALERQNLPPEVLSEYREAFALFDEDGDQNITVNELSHVFRSLGLDPYDDNIAEMIRDVDADGDGTVSFEEFLTMMLKSAKQADSDEDLRKAFKVFLGYGGRGDMEGGKKEEEVGLDWQTLKAVMAELGDKMSDEEAQQMVRLADKDHDGYVGMSEFISFLKTM